MQPLNPTPSTSKMSDIVFHTRKGAPATDSLKVAAKFNKLHKNVLATYRNLELSPEFNGLNFKLIPYRDNRGRAQERLVMTRAGFVRLVFGFTGKKSAAFKEEYIAEFDRMEVLLSGSHREPAQRKLTDYTSRAVQVQCVKEVGNALYLPGNDPKDIISHHRAVMKALTGKRPSAYVKQFVKQGLRVASFTGRQLLRRMEPAKACTAAFLDDARVRGKSLAHLEAAGVVEALPQAFDALLRAGYSLEELGA